MPEAETKPDRVSVSVSGKHARIFATTDWRVVLGAGQSDAVQAAAALETLCSTYWPAVFAFLRRTGHDLHSAQDLTQGFFLRLLERNDFAAVQPGKGRFRTFLLVALKHFLVNERLRASAAKRGGGRAPISWDDTMADDCSLLEPQDNLTPEKAFDRQWAMALFDRVLVRLRSEYSASGRERQFDCLKCYLTDSQPEASQEELSRELGLATGSVKVTVHRLRRRYRQLLREEVAQTVAKECDIEQELRDLITVLR